MSLPTDRFFTQQWYLHNSDADQYDINVVKAWDDYTGKGVRLVIMDDGVDYNNPDLSPHYARDDDIDVSENDADALPTYDSDSHGTSVAGVAAAARNGVGVVGVAYDAMLIGCRFDAFETGMASILAGGFDVVNMSFAFLAYFDAELQPAVDSVTAAIETGRGGLGTILVKAAGNERGNENTAQINGMTFDTDTRMISVAAIDRYGNVEDFSSYGAPVLVSAFGRDIYTTDRVGAAGYEPGNINPEFLGTSAATPQISGVTALMLQANPDLGWRDVQSILAYSSRHVGSVIDGTTTANSELFAWSFNAAKNWNGGGLHYSQDYGYGLVDALAAVRLAETWGKISTSVNQKTVTADILDQAVDLPDGDTGGVPVSTFVSNHLNIERIGLELSFIGVPRDLSVTLTGPDGREFAFFSRAGGDTGSQSLTFEFQSQQYRGEDAHGNWTVRLVDAVTGNALTVSDAKLNFYGAAPSRNDTYFYTNEFSAFTDSHTTTLSDTDGGTDTLNASAVTAAMTVNLAKGTGGIDGVAVTISGIENVFGGDGNDRLTGNDAANTLSGGRGRDVLTGGAGGDSFVFHVVDDSLSGSERDLIRDFTKGDHIDLSDIDTRANHGDQAFRFLGEAAFDGKAAELDVRQIDRHGTAHDITLIMADLDGDKHADFEIGLAGLHSLSKIDFAL